MISRAESTNRNDSCPCGSKKKYKKCCLKAEEGSSKILQFKKPGQMSTQEMEDVADGLIKELGRQKNIERWAQAVFNNRTPKTIVTENVSVSSKIMNELGAALRVPTNLCEAVGKDPI